MLNPKRLPLSGSNTSACSVRRIWSIVKPSWCSWWMQSIHCSDWPQLSVWRGGNPSVFVQDDNSRQTYKHRTHKDRQTGCGGHREYKNTLILFWPSFSFRLRAATNGQQSFCLVDLELSSPPLLLCSMWNTNPKTGCSISAPNSLLVP